MSNEKRTLDDFCPRCGLKISKVSRPGSMTGYLFDPVKCKCQVDDPSKTMGISQRLYNLANNLPVKAFAQLEEGAIVGGVYSIIKLIGQGGMGLVYLARHKTLGKKCAVKLVPPEQVTSDSWKRFQQEAKVIAGLDHINLVKVTDLGVHEGYLPFYAMEYVDGATLAEKLANEGPMPLKVALEIFTQVCDGVDYAHRAGIIHRDLKPANIMVTSRQSADGKVVYTPKVLDFGLAKLSNQDRDSQSLTSVGDIFGSPYYMSPEQCAGTKVDNRSDIYSLGCTLFECLTGRPPFMGNLSAAVIFSHQESDPPSLREVCGAGKFADSMEIVMAKLLRKNPVERYQTCRELKGDLERIVRGEDVQPFYVNRSAVAGERGQSGEVQSRRGDDHFEKTRSHFRSKLRTTAACAAGLLLVGGSGWYYLKTTERKQAKSTVKVVGKDKNIGLGPGDTDLGLEVSVGDKVEAASAASLETRKPTLEDETNAFATAPEVPKEIPASRFDLTPYSTIDKSHPGELTFNFPKDADIGMFRSLGQLGHAAHGQGIYIRNGKFVYSPSALAIKYPNYLKRFRPGELYGLEVSRINDINAAIPVLLNLPQYQSIRYLQLYVDKSEKPIAAPSLVLLRSLKNIDQFEFSSERPEAFDLSTLPWLGNQSALFINGKVDIDKVIAKLKHSSRLVDLTIEHNDLAEFHLRDIAAMPALKILNVQASIKTPAHLAILSSSPTIKSIRIPGRLLVEPTLYRVLHEAKNLRIISVQVENSQQAMRYNMLKRSFPQLKSDSDVDSEKRAMTVLPSPAE